MVLKRSLRENDQTAPHIAYVKNTWKYTVTPPLDLMVYSLIMHKSIYAFNFTWPNDVLVRKL